MGPAGGPEVVDVTATFPRKVAALRAHESQVGADVEAWVGEALRRRGEPVGYNYAESFRVVRRRVPPGPSP